MACRTLDYLLPMPKKFHEKDEFSCEDCIYNYGMTNPRDYMPLLPREGGVRDWGDRLDQEKMRLRKELDHANFGHQLLLFFEACWGHDGRGNSAARPKTQSGSDYLRFRNQVLLPIVEKGVESWKSEYTTATTPLEFQVLLSTVYQEAEKGLVDGNRWSEKMANSLEKIRSIRQSCDSRPFFRAQKWDWASLEKDLNQQSAIVDSAKFFVESSLFQRKQWDLNAESPEVRQYIDSVTKALTKAETRILEDHEAASPLIHYSRKQIDDAKVSVSDILTHLPLALGIGMFVGLILVYFSIVKPRYFSKKYREEKPLPNQIKYVLLFSVNKLKDFLLRFRRMIPTKTNKNETAQKIASDSKEEGSEENKLKLKLSLLEDAYNQEKSTRQKLEKEHQASQLRIKELSAEIQNLVNEKQTLKKEDPEASRQALREQKERIRHLKEDIIQKDQHLKQLQTFQKTVQLDMDTLARETRKLPQQLDIPADASDPHVYLRSLTHTISQLHHLAGKLARKKLTDTWRDQIAENKIKIVIEAIRSYASSHQLKDIRNEITLLASRWNDLQQEKESGILPGQEAQRSATEVKKSLIKLIDRIEEREKSR